MSDETKKVEKKTEEVEQEAKAAELSDKDLDKVAGGKGWDLQKNAPAVAAPQNKTGGTNPL